MKKLRKISIMVSLLVLFSFVISPLGAVWASEINKVAKEEFKEGQVYHGFKLEKQEEISDYNALGRMFVHEKSGARVFQFKNDDPNKFCAIGLKTPIDNNEGTAHVFEHALLMGGSEKYPVKQLLNYLISGSLCNNLNGFTMYDSTAYPFATVHEEEFRNVMDVYLDMVFNASIKSSENIFKEEAWHYELESLEDELEYKGVVLSEMKGNASNSIRKLILATNRSLFPDTTYNFNSGGDPKHIPELTYEEVVKFYEKYYTPSNSLVFVYGDTTIDDKLKNMNEGCLKGRTKSEKVTIKAQKPHTKQKDYEDEYGIAVGQPTEGMDYLGLNYVIGKSADLETIYTASLLKSLILDDRNSLFQQKMIEAGFQNVIAIPTFQQIDSVFSIVALNTDRSKKELFKKTVKEALEETVKQGINEELLQATINNYELQSKLGMAFTSGTGESLYNIVHIANTYDADLIDMFNGEKAVLEKIKNASKTKHFEKFIENKILNNNFSSVVTLKAVPGLNEKDAAEEKAKLKKYKDSLTKSQKEALIKDNKQLVEWQNTLESEEILKKIPMIDVNTLEPQVKVAPLELRRVGDTKILYTQGQTNGTNNIKFNFNTQGVKQELIPYISLLGNVIGSLDTNNFTNEELTNEVLKYTDGISFNATAIGTQHRNGYIPMMQVSVTSLNENMDQGMKLAKELMLNVKLDDKEKLKNVIAQIKTAVDIGLDKQLSGDAQVENLKRTSDCLAYNSLIGGLDYCNFINDIYTNFDKNYDQIINNLKEVYETVFNTSNLEVALISEEKAYSTFENNLKDFVKSIPNKKQAIEHYEFNVEDKDKAFVAQSQVSYNVVSFNSKELGFNIDSTNEVVNSIVSDLLYYTHRVEGKAYGAYMSSNDKGDFVIYTYRDPRVGESFDDLEKIPDYLRDPKNYESKLNQYKLNALKKFYYPKSVYEMGDEAQWMYYIGTNKMTLIKDLNDTLNTTIEDIKAYADIFEKGLKNARINTIGNKDGIENSKDKFEVIENLME